MTTLEITDRIEQLLIQARQIIANGEAEKRKLTEDEETEYTSICKQIEDSKEELRKLNLELEDNKKDNLILNTEIRKEMKNFSLLKAINDVANNRNLDERSQEVVNKGIEEMRKAGQSYSGQIVLPIEERAEVKATVATAGQEVVAEDKLNILEPLRNNLVLSAAGATYMSGLVGNVSIPVYDGSNVAWADETGAAVDGAGKFSEVNLEPKRLTAYLDISKQFLIQDSVSAEQMLRNDLVRAISEKLESTILGKEAGSTKQPEGIFNGVAADQKDVDFAAIVAMEQALEEKNVSGNLTFLASPATKAALKTTLKDAKNAVSGYIMSGDEVDGIKVLSTNSVATKGLVLGNWADYVIGQWGGIDLTVDPFSQATNGKIRLVINAYFDAKPRRADAFAKKIMK